jgi:hypothetical protein
MRSSVIFRINGTDVKFAICPKKKKKKKKKKKSKISLGENQ